MNLLDLQFWYQQQRVLGLIGIVIGLGAWGMEFAGAVYVCPYCRVQRTVILLLGCVMLLPSPRHWITKYVASVVGFLGAVVAVNQNFMGWVKISKGEFAFNENLFCSRPDRSLSYWRNSGSYWAALLRLSKYAPDQFIPAMPRLLGRQVNFGQHFNALTRAKSSPPLTRKNVCLPPSTTSSLPSLIC